MLLPVGITVLLCLGTVRGFLPNHESGGIDSTVFTDADITEEGVLRAVAHYMETNPLPGRSPMAPGELENMKSLTATELFRAFFKADVSPNRLVKAIQELISANNQVEVSYAENSNYFFHCEKIAPSITQMRNLRDSMLSSLKEPVSSSDLESARQSAGQALHILQQFYSNTNWPELGKGGPYDHLLNPASPAFPVAPASKETCRDCSKDESNQLVCDGNILVNDLLTSGYKLTASCRRKPKGKCGHGGRNDPAEMFPTTGGINKETTDPRLSPHYQLHQQAAELAIQATRDFFVGDGYGLLDQVGSDTFKRFFNLEGYSLTFVIDTTGSMSEDIHHVITTSFNLLQEFSSSPDKPFNYILVPFNDPDVGPVQVTQDVDELKTLISNLRPTGGGDCPEMSLSGLKLALEHSLPRSKIYIFTDAGAKDEHLKDEVQVLLDSSGSEVNYALTGYCSSRKRRSAAEEASGRSYANIYEELAAYSGGFYVMTTKGELDQVLGIMELSLNAAPVTVAHKQLDGSQCSFPVDETLTEITVSVKSLHSLGFTITVRQPSGVSPSTHTVINTSSHKIVKVSPIPERGMWTVTVSPSGSYEVEIGGKSLLDISYQIMQKQKEYVLPVQGKPVKGSNYTVSLRLVGGAKGARVQHLIPISGLGNPLDSITLNQTSDALGNVLAIAPVFLHTPTTLLSVEGLSPENLPFSRVSSYPISTESVQILPVPDQNSTMAPGESLEVSVMVVNEGTAAAFSFKVWDDFGFLESFTPTESFLNSGESVVLRATFTAPLKNSSFTSSTATFTAKSSATQNYLRLPITVISENDTKTDEIPPNYALLDLYMPCVSKFQHKPTCSRHIWKMRFSAMDNHSAVTVQITANPSGLSCSPRGTDGSKEVMCHYQSNCCSPYAEFLISDENGNTKTFTVDYRRPRPASTS
uniref:von Willebrand factor A domain-containing protein 7-like n=1 Tax=Podarcis muralis TaxID=64176 RepID=UPI0010A052F6|nr:von Willebrand factor A domain-containing protein 7-like [Podarcis muralis]